MLHCWPIQILWFRSISIFAWCVNLRHYFPDAEAKHWTELSLKTVIIHLTVAQNVLILDPGLPGHGINMASKAMMSYLSREEILEMPINESTISSQFSSFQLSLSLTLVAVPLHDWHLVSHFWLKGIFVYLQAKYR